MLYKTNLNELKQRHTDYFNMEPSDLKQRDNSATVSGIIEFESHFKNLDKALVEKISQADAIVGCVAWLTNMKILNALATVKEGVSIVVQKEDFLRPDYANESDYKARLRRQYDCLRPLDPSCECVIEKRATDIGECEPGRVDISVRCVGHLKDKDEFAMPRMHHKFMVFCDSIEYGTDFWNVMPYAVWTGSFNMTDNATKSNENGIFIKNQEIAQSYFMEWFDMLLVSEALDWSSKYAAPDLQFNNLACIS